MYFLRCFSYTLVTTTATSRKMQGEIAINTCVTDIWHSNLYEMLLLVSYPSDENNNAVLYCYYILLCIYLLITSCTNHAIATQLQRVTFSGCANTSDRCMENFYN